MSVRRQKEGTTVGWARGGGGKASSTGKRGAGADKPNAALDSFYQLFVGRRFELVLSSGEVLAGRVVGVSRYELMVEAEGGTLLVHKGHVVRARVLE